METAEANPGSCVSLQVALQSGWLPISKHWHYYVAGDSQLYRPFGFGWLQTCGNRKSSCAKMNDKLLHVQPWLLNWWHVSVQATAQTSQEC